jgi:hypothetical protein
MKKLLTFLLIVCCVSVLSCRDDEEPNSVFKGTARWEDTDAAASGVKLTFTGFESSGGLWPSYTEVISKSVTVSQSGQFEVSIPYNSRIDTFSLTAEDSGSTLTVVSGCPHWACEHFEPGKMTELTLKVAM